MKTPAQILSPILGLLLAVPALAGIDAWGPSTQLDPREPLEIGHPLAGVGGASAIPVPVLFGTVPEFQLFLVDTRGIVPTATAQTITADGSIFALGRTGETSSGAWGGTYIDNFDLRFWRSVPPHATVQSVLIDGAATWIDSSSAAAGSTFYASGVNFNTGGIQVFFSSTNGLTWAPLRTFVPAQTLYENFDGGERVSLWVAPADTDPATARNCFLYETVNGGTTTKRVNCANGAAQVFDVAFLTDVPGAQGGEGREGIFAWIENMMAAAEAEEARGVVTRRSDQSKQYVAVHGDGTVDVVPAGAPPPGPDPSGFGLASSSPTRVDVLTPAGDGVPGTHDTWNPQTGQIDSRPGPTMRRGPAVLRRGPDLFFSLITFFLMHDDFDGVLTGLGVAQFPATFFGDGFESGDTSGWSSVVP